MIRFWWPPFINNNYCCVSCICESSVLLYDVLSTIHMAMYWNAINWKLWQAKPKLAEVRIFGQSAQASSLVSSLIMHSSQPTKTVHILTKPKSSLNKAENFKLRISHCDSIRCTIFFVCNTRLCSIWIFLLNLGADISKLKTKS